MISKPVAGHLPRYFVAIQKNKLALDMAKSGYK